MIWIIKMNNKERLFISITLFVISTLTLFDMLTDLKNGVTLGHVSFEGIVALMAAIGLALLLKSTFGLKRGLKIEKNITDKLKEENEKYRIQSKSYLEGLSATINDQLTQWELTKSEKQIAFLLLKGFSLKEIASIRGTSEKTTRTQSASIYSKAGLASRSQLSAFFLEDLLLPLTK